jgi:7-carboxy-7-deazaguanine synthase
MGELMSGYLKVLEHYTSVQGEGFHTGKLTQFVRFAGCNLRCPGWPCDTPQAIFPNQYHGKFDRDIPDRCFARIERQANTNGAKHICFTGGEPFMQDNKVLQAVVMLLTDYGYTVEFFTNGTYTLPWWALRNTIMLDWKLKGSGEDLKFEQRNTRAMNAKDLHPECGIKFVCTDDKDLREAVLAAEQLRQFGTKATFWVGTAWDSLKEADIVQFMKDNRLTDWRLNVQVHKYIYDPEARFV